MQDKDIFAMEENTLDKMINNDMCMLGDQILGVLNNIKSVEMYSDLEDKKKEQ